MITGEERCGENLTDLYTTSCSSTRPTQTQIERADVMRGSWHVVRDFDAWTTREWRESMRRSGRSSSRTR